MFLFKWLVIALAATWFYQAILRLLQPNDQNYHREMPPPPRRPPVYEAPPRPEGDIKVEAKNKGNGNEEYIDYEEVR